MFSLLFDAGTSVGTALVRHPTIKAVGFTGSLTGGRALMDIASSRSEPIPCFAEMSSTNPVFILPSALENDPVKLADGLYGSFTLGAGQFCTKPGAIFVPDGSAANALVRELQQRAANAPEFTLLTPGIAQQYSSRLGDRADASPKSSECSARAAVLESEIDVLLKNPSLLQEVFGPATLVVRHKDRQQLLQAAESLQGHLTATLFGTPQDLASNGDLISILERKVGRLIFNGFPTGVEVTHAMVHGGPYPASSDGRFTSVGSQAIFRFTRPVCYQNFNQTTLPQELKNGNPLRIWRMINGKMTRRPVPADPALRSSAH